MKRVLFFLFVALGCHPCFAATGCGEDTSEFGCVSIPFTASLTETEIKAKMQDILGDKVKVDIVALKNTLRAKLSQYASLSVFEDALNKIVDAAILIIVDQAKDYNKKVDSAIAEAAKKTKDAIDKAAPKAEISGNYDYKEKCKNPGDPGWSLNSPELGGFTAASGSGGIDLVIPVKVALTPLGVGGEVETTVELHCKISVSVEAELKHPSGPNPKTDPTTTVGCTPALKITGSGEYTVGVILSVTVGASVTGVKNLPAVTGSLVAGTDGCSAPK